jgi:hypothetical protein
LRQFFSESAHIALIALVSLAEIGVAQFGLQVDTTFLEFQLIGADFRGVQQKYSAVVEEIIEAAHLGDKVLPSPSDVYRIFLTEKWCDLGSE